MRSYVVTAMFLANFASAAANDYTEVRDLELDSDGIEKLEIEAGAGGLEIKGVAGLNKIVVKAIVVVPDADDDDAIRLVEKRLKLSLDGNAGRAKLDSWFEKGFFGTGSGARIDLDISMPAGIALIIDDGSGFIHVSDVAAAISIDDGSGSINLENVAKVTIDDGSGSVDVSNAAGDVSIVDGSGNIIVRGVQGSVSIDDGSGGIQVSDVERDLVIIDDGSGGLSFSDVRGKVEGDS
jgi:hypothetical protein